MTQARSDFEYEYEDEFEGEEFLGGLAKIAGSLLGEGEYEDEYEDEFEGEFEDEYEDEFEDEYEGEFEDEYEYELEGEGEFEDEYESEDEAFFGGLAKVAGSLLGEGEYEDEDEAEYFFKNIGRFVRRHSGLLKKIAKTAAPMLATAVGGPAAGLLARAVTSQLEGEFEDELEAELEDMATAPVSPNAALGEYLAARAATAETEGEAEAFIGSAITSTLSRGDRRELEELLPHLLRGAHVLTRILHRNPATRPAVRFVPGIVDSTSRTLANRIGSGQSVSPADIGAVMGGSARRVLGDPRWTAAVGRRHARGLAQVRRRRYRHVVGHRTHGPVLTGTRGSRGAYRPRGSVGAGYRRRPVGTGYRPRGSMATGYRPRVTTVRRQPISSRVISGGPRATTPRAGVVRIVTPVRVPSRNGVPARTVRVVSDVKVPRGAVPAGRPAARAVARRR